MSNTNHQLMALLDQYAQESGFLDLADLKHNYHPRAYAQVIAVYLRRANSELEAAE